MMNCEKIRQKITILFVLILLDKTIELTEGLLLIKAIDCGAFPLLAFLAISFFKLNS